MSDLRVIITGASDGIGKALALELAKRGAVLGLLARRQEKLEELKTLCLSQGSPATHIAAVDVTEEHEFARKLLDLDQKLDGATGFIANAGVSDRSNLTSESWSQAKGCLQVNLMAAIHGLELMKLQMLKRKSGTLAGVTSIAAARGMPTSGAYSTSKAALATHLETLRVDLAPWGIRVVNLAPGFIDTEMTKKNKGKMPFLMQPDVAAKKFIDGFVAGHAFVVVPRPWRWIYPLIQMTPHGLFDWVARRAYRKIRGDSPGDGGAQLQKP